MFIRTFLLSGVLALTALADFSYEQSTRVTGGSMAGMMRVAGAFSKSAREPMRTTVMVKGDRLAMASSDNINIVDLSAETITDINLEKKTYAVITFADMGRALEQMAKRMSGEKQPGSDVQFKAEVKKTGRSKIISDLNTSETILTLRMEGSDQSGGKGAMDFQMEMWMAPSIAGYNEVREFYMRMAQKMPWNPMTNRMASQMMAQHGKGMSELANEMAKLDGVPVLQITRIGAVAQGLPAESGESNAPAQSREPAPSASEAAGDAATGAALGRAGRIASGLGGLGGFGRRKKQQEQPEQPQQTREAPQTQPAQSGPVSLMELTTELSSFSSSAVDAARLQVPAGFRQVPHDMEKMLK